jgi:cytochrome oxidase Cu insertion factor (SCO1/SenC/PrrC family)
VEFVVVSTDPADTPASVSAFAARSGWDPGLSWHWLMGSKSRLAVVWRAYGVSVSDALAHTSVIYLVGADGYERAGLGTPGPTAGLVTDIKALISTSASGTSSPPATPPCCDDLG